MATRKSPNQSLNLDEADYVEFGGVRFVAVYGDDSTPLMNKVRDKPETWGRLTSSGRTNSASYLAFVAKHKQARDDEAKRRGR